MYAYVIYGLVAMNFYAFQIVVRLSCTIDNTLPLSRTWTISIIFFIATYIALVKDYF